LKAVRGWVNGNSYREAVLRGRLIGVLPRIVATRREFIAGGLVELEWLAISAIEGICQRVESKATGVCHSGDNIRGSDEGMGCRVSIITTREVAVVRSDNYGTLLADADQSEKVRTH
jgi:hypothetical protein